MTRLTDQQLVIIEAYVDGYKPSGPDDTFADDVLALIAEVRDSRRLRQDVEQFHRDMVAMCRHKSIYEGPAERLGSILHPEKVQP